MSYSLPYDLLYCDVVSLNFYVPQRDISSCISVQHTSDMIITDAISIAPYYPDSHFIKRCNFDRTIVFPQIGVLDRILSPHLPYLTTLRLLSCCIQLFHIRLVLCEHHVVGIILFIAHNVCTQTVDGFPCTVIPACME